MAWNKIRDCFPLGHEFNDVGFVTADDLDQLNEIDVVIAPDCKKARNMIIEDLDYIFGKNDEYAVGIRYNVYDMVEHPSSTQYPLSVYGMAMVNDYLYYHTLEEDKNE